jgi:hypothetical protein
MKERIKELIEKELRTCHAAEECSVNDIKLNSDLGIAIMENVVKKLTIPDVIKPLICCGTCIWMNDGDCDMGEPCIDFRLWETN